MTVQLPPGVIPEPKQYVQEGQGYAQGVPWGAGRPIRIADTDKTYLARAEIVREQKPKVGKPAFYQSSEEILHAAVEYFAWSDANPLYQRKTQFSATTGTFYAADHPLKRPWTIKGLCCYMGISHETWTNYKRNPDYNTTCLLIEDEIFQQKFAGAAAGFFNAAIIARDLGLADKQEVSGPGGGPIEKVDLNMSAEEAAEIYRKAREG